MHYCIQWQSSSYISFLFVGDDNTCVLVATTNKKNHTGDTRLTGEISEAESSASPKCTERTLGTHIFIITVNKKDGI